MKRELTTLATMVLSASFALAQGGAFTLPNLPYKTDALEPVITQQTIELHWGKHLRGYINNLNKLVPDSQYKDATLEEMATNATGAIFNNAAQTWNHILYFNTFSPDGSREPKGKLLKAIERDFGSVEEFKSEFQKKGAAIFGSGWVWLSKDSKGKLHITAESNAGNPLDENLVPLIGIDVWEHAYYLDYQNRRAEHLQKIWDIVDWNIVEDRY